jgi:hypothetical protein
LLFFIYFVVKFITIVDGRGGARGGQAGLAHPEKFEITLVPLFV